MSENKVKNYDQNENKTEFLFESDAEKVVLKEASKPKKIKIYKKIFINTIFICFFITIMTLVLNNYQKKQIKNITASLGKINASNKIDEKLNSFSNDLNLVNNNLQDKYSIIVNKANPISEEILNSYVLTNVENNIYNGIKIEQETYKNYLKLKENLLERGYYINIIEGFKTFNESKIIYNNYKRKNGINYAEKYIAKPGTSEHNTGLAFDFIISNNKNSYETNYKSEEYFYLENIAYLYGFIIRYPKDKEKVTGYNYIPYHLRYVGVNLAKYLKKNNLTLEEYYK